VIETTFTKLVGCTRPLQLAGMPGIVTTELACAVAGEGALATVPATLVPAPVLAERIEAIQQQTGARVGVNFLMPYLDTDAVDEAARRARVVEFFYGAPSRDLVHRVHVGGALACWQAGSLEEAAEAEAAGCDFVVIQGIEAGGHVRGSLGLMPLLSRVLGALRVPVVAAGGIGTAREVAAALAAGAAGVRVGTRFVAAAEAGSHPDYIEALLHARAEDTVLTEAYEVGWPNAPHRVLRSCITAATACADDVVGEDTMGGMTFPVQRFSPPAPTRHATGQILAMALYAGHSVDAVRRIEPAADIVRELSDGAEELLREAAARCRL
jgi:nitronate monooxygenase